MTNPLRSFAKGFAFTLAAIFGGLLVGEAQISIPYTFTTGTTISSTQVNSNFAQVGSNALNRTGGTMTGTLTSQNLIPSANNTYDLGSSSFKFNNAYINAATITTLTTSNLDASTLTSGTVPDGRFPATLPAASGENLTALDADNLATGTIPDARFPATLPAASGTNLTNLDASDLASGTVPDARLSAGTRGYVLQFASLQFDPDDAHTYFIGAFPRVPPESTGGANRLYIPRAGTITRILLGVTNAGTAGSTTSSTVVLRLNDSSDVLTITSSLNTSANSWTSLTGLSQAVAAGDFVEVKWTTPTWATNPTSVRFGGHLWIE